MPSFTNGPGVYVNETLASNFVTATSTGPAAAFFGTAPRGPVGATLVTDWVSYKRLFGDLEDAYDLGYAVYHFFANGGRNAYVCRVVDAEAVKATVTVPYFPDGTGSASAGLCTVTAISEGTWGNSVTIDTQNGLSGSADNYSTFSIIVKNNGVEVERWPEVSLDPNSNRFITTIVNTYSSFISVSNAASADYTGDFGVTGKALASGTDGTIGDADWSNAFDLIDTVTGSLVLNAVGKTPTSDTSVITALINKASSRGDSFVIVDPDKGMTTLSEITSSASNLSSVSSAGYAAHYSPCLKMVDPSKTGPGAIRVTYPGGAVAGIMSRIENRRTTAAAPAGYGADIVGAFGLEVPLSDANIGTLYQGTTQVNSFKAIPGAGVVVYGTRTLARTEPDKFIPVRRTLNYLKAELKSITDFAVFEPNDQNLWTTIHTVVSAFLNDFFQKGGLKGTSPSQAFYIVCDATNNTASTIDQGYVNVEVGVSLLYPAEYIVINLSQWNGGANAVENL